LRSLAPSSDAAEVERAVPARASTITTGGGGSGAGVVPAWKRIRPRLEPSQTVPSGSAKNAFWSRSSLTIPAGLP
jgi:hypothetical protein